MNSESTISLTKYIVLVVRFIIIVLSYNPFYFYLVFRYLTMSQNELEALPCSLLQCRLEYLDISTNKFHNSETSSKSYENSPWDFYIGDLAHLSTKVVLKCKIFYAPNIIPWTLVEFLDNANMCVCGSPVVNDQISLVKKFELKDYFRTVVFDNNRTSIVGFECYYCSPKCFKKWGSIRDC